MPYEIPIIARDRCCTGSCDSVTAPAGCYEVYEPGRSLSVPNRFWITTAGEVINAIGQTSSLWPDETPYETDCYPVDGGSNALHTNAAALRSVGWGKLASCGPYVLTGNFGPPASEDPLTARTTTQLNDLRWFETIGYVKDATVPTSFWKLRPCSRPYLTAQAGPECVYVPGKFLDQPEALAFESTTATACDMEFGPNDLIGKITDGAGSVLTWRIDETQTNIIITYGDYTGTMPFEREWWKALPELFNEAEDLINVYDCADAPCDNENSCWPDLCPCLVDGADGTLYRTIYADVFGDHTETELSLLPDSGAGRYQWTRGGSDAITILCMNGGLDSYMVSVSLGPDSYFCTIPASGLQCNGRDLVDEIIVCGDITIRLYTL